MRAGRRYLAEGAAGWIDRRADNRRSKVDDDCLSAPGDVLDDRASDHA